MRREKPQNTTHWKKYAWISRKQAIQDAQSIASILVDPDGKGLKDYWDQGKFLLSGRGHTSLSAADETQGKTHGDHDGSVPPACVSGSGHS